jgi:hypothetical protein
MKVARFAGIVMTVAVALAGIAMAAGTPAARAARAALAVQAVQAVQAGHTAAHASFSAVSCPSASFCLAVGSQLRPSGGTRALAEEWNGRAWRVLKDPPGKALDGVSCPSASFCLAWGLLKGTGGFNFVETWNGHAWRTAATPPFPRSGITCGSPQRCLVISGRTGDTSTVLYLTGTRWRGLGTNPCDIGPLCSLSAVSCSTATNCMAVGSVATDDSGDSFEGFTSVWDGSSWNLSTVPSLPVDSVTCARPAFCLTVDEHGTVEAWSAGQGWHDATPAGTCASCRINGPVSCGSASFCTAISGYTSVSVNWNGSTWRRVKMVPAPRSSNSLFAVSCATRWACLAVGVYFTKTENWALAERWNGARWELTKTPVVS